MLISRYQDISILLTLQLQNPKGKRAQYYMKIFKEAYCERRQNAESDETFKKRFTTEGRA